MIVVDINGPAPANVSVLVCNLPQAELSATGVDSEVDGYLITFVAEVESDAPIERYVLLPNNMNAHNARQLEDTHQSSNTPSCIFRHIRKSLEICTNLDRLINCL